MIRRSQAKKYAPGFMMPIGGKVDKDENPYLAAEREVYEEAGIRVKNMRLEAVVMEIKPVHDEDENWLIFHFSADYDSGEIQKTPEGEFVLLSAEEVKEEHLFPSIKYIIGHILNPQDGTVFATCVYDEQGNLREGEQSLKRCEISGQR